MATLTAGSKGPVLLQDYVFFDEMAHFDRERIPERVVHAKGAGLCMREYMYICIVIFVFAFYSVLILVIYFTFFPFVFTFFLSLSLPLSSPGAFGYFEVTHITNLCKAKVFSKVGKRTPIAVRFSTVGEPKFITLLYLCTVAVS